MSERSVGPAQRFVLAGAGNIGGVHAEALIAAGAAPAAVVEVDRARLDAFGEKYGIAARYTSLEAALDGEPGATAVVLATPPVVHREQAVAALERGLTVYCEKPPALSLADFDAITAAEDASAGSFATVFQQRYGSSAQQLRDLAAGGSLGRPVTAVCNTLWFRPAEYFAVDWRGRWESEGGGPTMGHGIHQMDLLLSILGPWREVTAVATRIAQPTNTEDVSAAIVTFSSGAVATVLNTLLAPRQTSYLRFDFENATAELEHYDRYGDENWTLTAGPEITAAWEAGRTAVASGHSAQLAAVLAALDAGQPPPVTSASARATLELSAAIYASAFTGSRVRRGEIAPGSPFYDRMDGGGAPWPPVK
ncbi:MAG: gfo/Idh/MocA family oxidoreductase [Actinomycetia bacterium]|nr:gfo/Idh/MocA family oxidoreductase [Actinomycetes bacterium]MDQ1659814.1 hypothetical protein [Cryptosporangiaceae bacterium]